MPGPATRVGRWHATRAKGTARELLAKASLGGGAEVRLLTPVRPALILGSTQSEQVFALDRLHADGVDLVQRRSGGGAVWMDPITTLWIDITIARDDALWRADVGQAFYWLGRVWAAAITQLGVDKVEVHEGPTISGPWSKLVCFGGLGAGEVTVAGRKVVGISQRRTRIGALFQSAALIEWNPEAILAALNLDPAQRRRAESDLSQRAAATGVGHAMLTESFLANLP